MHPAVQFTGRTVSDRLSTPRPEATIMQGDGSQQPSNSSWCDVSNLSIDPVDDCTFWYTSQYYQTDSTSFWNTRIASFRFTSCH